MNTLKLAAFSPVLLALLATGCAAQTTEEDPSSTEDQLTAGSVTGSNAQALMDALRKANAPSNNPPHFVGSDSRIARLQLTTAQGGMAHFISRGGGLSTIDGADLANVVTLGLDWNALSGALLAGGLSWQTEQGEHGASSSKMFAKVECRQVVAPGARPGCTVSPISVTEADSKTLMHLLTKANAPSNNPPHFVGSSSRIARVTLTTAQGGMAHFISQGLSVATLDGQALGDISSLDTPWADARTALLDGAAVWKTTNGDHGATSSKIVATVLCRQVVVPGAKPSCKVTPEVVE